MRRSMLLAVLLAIVLLFGMSATAAAAQQHFTAESEGTLSDVWYSPVGGVVPGSIAVSIKASSVGDLIETTGPFDGYEWDVYKGRGVVHVEVDVTLPPDIPLHLHLAAAVKQIEAPHNEWQGMYFLNCLHKGHPCTVGVDPDTGVVFLQLMAPYLGTVNPVTGNWSYGWLPIATGDFSFTYNP